MAKRKLNIEQVIDALKIKTDCRALTIVNKGNTMLFVDNEQFRPREGMEIACDPGDFLENILQFRFDDVPGVTYDVANPRNNLAYVRRLLK